MGWWSATVLGGDTPLDWHGMLCDVMGVKMSDDGEGYYGYAYTRELTESHTAALVEKVESENWQQPIGWQVLGAILLKVGAPISAHLKTKIVQATKDDEWAREGDVERIRWMTDLAEKIENAQPGVRTDVTAEGLLAKVLESEDPADGEQA